MKKEEVDKCNYVYPEIKSKDKMFVLLCSVALFIMCDKLKMKQTLNSKKFRQHLNCNACLTILITLPVTLVNWI